MTGIFHCAAVQNCIKMPLITCPNVGSREVFKYQMEKKHLESEKCQGLPPETLNSSKSIVKRDNGYCVCCVMLRLNIQTTSVGIKSYVKKVKSHCLPVMYATSNSNLNIIGGAQASSYQNSFCFQHLLKVFQEERPPKKSQGSM